MNKNKQIKIKERRWKRPHGGPTCLENYLEKILAFVEGNGGPFINMALALELQFPMK